MGSASPLWLLLIIGLSQSPSGAVGLEIERHLPGGVRSLWQRDKLGRPLKHEIWSGKKLLGAKSYTWEPNDRLKMIVDALHGPARYGHDGMGNLAAVVYSDSKIDLRMPDAVGNLFHSNDRRDRKYGPAGQLLESLTKEGITRYSYDPEGNLALKALPDGSTWKYEWNAAGMLAKVIRPDGQEVTFGYDALGRRVWKKYKGKTTQWIWDGNVPVHEWVELEPGTLATPAPEMLAESEDAGLRQRAVDLAKRESQGPPPLTPALSPQSGARGKEGGTSAQVSGSISPPRGERARVRGTPDQPITWVFEPESFAPAAKLTGNQQFAIITDHLGTPTAMLDAEGSSVWAADIGIYGELRHVVGEKQACPFRWPGQYEDEETGLYYNFFRYYDPESGEYVSQDPIGLRGGTAVYSYVGDPLNRVDPLGLASCSSKKPIIIGENMGRVDDFAKKVDGETISDWLKGRTWTQQVNDDFIAAMKKEGREIHDIGPDFARRARGVPPSAVYGTERKALDGYGNYTSWYDRSHGGVPGFD